MDRGKRLDVPPIVNAKPVIFFAQTSWAWCPGLTGDTFAKKELTSP